MISQLLLAFGCFFIGYSFGFWLVTKQQSYKLIAQRAEVILSAARTESSYEEHIKIVKQIRDKFVEIENCSKQIKELTDYDKREDNKG
jgi:hypothetical protein